MNFACILAMLLSSMRFARGWTARNIPSFQQLGVLASPQRAFAPSQLRSYNSFRWSDDEFQPLSATSRSYNNTLDDQKPDRDLVSVQELIADTQNVNFTRPGQVDSMKKASLGPNQNIAMPPLDTEEIVGVLGIDPHDVQIICKNTTGSLDKPAVMSANEMFRNSHFVEMFRGSANYIANHRNSLMVFHIPGDWIDHPDPKIFRDLMNDISLSWLLGVKIVIVVGCKYQVEKRIGYERKRHLGMVVTDPESLRIVKEEAGYVRFEVERQLARSLQGSRGSNGLDGNVVSGNFFSAQPFGVLDGVDYQFSGFVRRFEAEKIHQCHANRDIVLLTTLGVSPTGEVFNVNSEYLAAYAGGGEYYNPST